EDREADGLGGIPVTKPPLTTPLERRDILPQLSMTLEHVGQLNVLTQKLSSLIKHFHTVIILVSYKERFLVTNAAGGMIQPFWAVVSKLKHRFTIHCKHLNSAVSKLRYNDKTSVTCNTNTYRRHKLSISTSLFAKAFHKVPCLYIQLLYSELITYGILVTGTFKKQVPELNL
ncbi:hypothetical protein pdam_00025683, partial [Pocillopora damicornis]